MQNSVTFNRNAKLQPATKWSFLCLITHNYVYDNFLGLRGDVSSPHQTPGRTARAGRRHRLCGRSRRQRSTGRGSTGAWQTLGRRPGVSDGSRRRR